MSDNFNLILGITLTGWSLGWFWSVLKAPYHFTIPVEVTIKHDPTTSH